nr:hypothetical protein P9270_013030 [Mesorhizobium sp. WSM4875]
MNKSAPLSGLRILVVEDAFLVALDLSDELTDAGCHVVGPAPSVQQALEQIDGVELDGAVLDCMANAVSRLPSTSQRATFLSSSSPAMTAQRSFPISSGIRRDCRSQ